MNLLQAIVLGLVQGLGEFLPISSSAHLVLAPWFLDFPDPGLSFDVALHLGTLIAIALYFWRDWAELIRTVFFPSATKYKLTKASYRKSTFWLLVIATVPGAVLGALLETRAETAFRNPLLIAVALSIMGFALLLADKYAKHTRGINDMRIRDALLIGLSQAIAIVPGVSRSGSTITTGLFLGLDRTSSARFSFLMSAPIILGATILKSKHLFDAGTTEVVAIFVAAVSGYIAIAWMMKFIQRVSYKIFFWYRLFLAIVIVAVWLAK